jgi:hypothetical protein
MSRNLTCVLQTSSTVRDLRFYNWGAHFAFPTVTMIWIMDNSELAKSYFHFIGRGIGPFDRPIQSRILPFDHVDSIARQHRNQKQDSI